MASEACDSSNSILRDFANSHQVFCVHPYLLPCVLGLLLHVLVLPCVFIIPETMPQRAPEQIESTEKGEQNTAVSVQMDDVELDTTQAVKSDELEEQISLVPETTESIERSCVEEHSPSCSDLEGDSAQVNAYQTVASEAPAGESNGPLDRVQNTKWWKRRAWKGSDGR